MTTNADDMDTLSNVMKKDVGNGKQLFSKKSETVGANVTVGAIEILHWLEIPSSSKTLPVIFKLLH